MSFGEPDRGGQPWSLPAEASFPIIRAAVENGVNFFDTANVYSLGSSEEIVGAALKEFARRDEVVIATKVRRQMHEGPNGSGLSRKAIFAEIDNSLRRLGTDYVDLYQIHRSDPSVPIEETLEALHDVVKAGKARYIGASSMYAWQFSKMLYTAEMHNWTRFSTMQNFYNLIYREEEREMLPLCADRGIGVIPWSPLARGRLARAWDETTARSENEPVGSLGTAENDRFVLEAVGAVAEKRNVPRAQVALAWLLSRAEVSAPIVGVTKLSQLDDAFAALYLELTEEEIDTLESPYEPHRTAGH